MPLKSFIFLIVLLLSQTLFGQNQSKQLPEAAQKLIKELDEKLQFTEVQQLQVHDIFIRWQEERKKLFAKKKDLPEEVFKKKRRQLKRKP